ncbi:hypothetical protein ALSL_2112 [Aerosticca soli]|uniref:Uncharacterized protein n=1 Tax=Aerosticca soli TaxID=2010829 RepID=A0A2Z6E891_9GAMM|nr:hypothetical protein ALSL_2112 [Aerosticca soli]
MLGWPAPRRGWRDIRRREAENPKGKHEGPSPSRSLPTPARPGSGSKGLSQPAMTAGTPASALAAIQARRPARRRMRRSTGRPGVQRGR